MGRIVSRISPTIYLVSFNELFEGKEFWREKIIPLSAMCDWEVSDEDDFCGWGCPSQNVGGRTKRNRAAELRPDFI